jgi:Tfp pilus assembly protein PilW
MHRSLRNLGEAGFTITEMLVASTVGLVALAAFTSFNITQMYGMRNQASQVDLQTSARAITDLFAREVRRGGGGTNVNCVGTVSTGLLLAQPWQVRVRLDLNGNGVLTDPNEDVTYTFDYTNNKITRTDNGALRTETLWSGVSLAGSRITYFDSAGNELAPGSTGLSAAQLLQVVRIRLQLALTGKVSQPGNPTQQTARESTNITLRNRYFVMASTCAYR